MRWQSATVQAHSTALHWQRHTHASAPVRLVMAPVFHALRPLRLLRR